MIQNKFFLLLGIFLSISSFAKAGDWEERIYHSGYGGPEELDHLGATLKFVDNSKITFYKGAIFAATVRLPQDGTKYNLAQFAIQIFAHSSNPTFYYSPSSVSDINSKNFRIWSGLAKVEISQGQKLIRYTGDSFSITPIFNSNETDLLMGNSVEATHFDDLSFSFPVAINEYIQVDANTSFKTISLETKQLNQAFSTETLTGPNFKTSISEVTLPTLQGWTKIDFEWLTNLNEYQGVNFQLEKPGEAGNGTTPVQVLWGKLKSAQNLPTCRSQTLFESEIISFSEIRFGLWTKDQILNDPENKFKFCVNTGRLADRAKVYASKSGNFGTCRWQNANAGDKLVPGPYCHLIVSDH